MPTIDELKNYFKDNNYLLLSNEYKDEKTILKIVCEKHNHESEISLKNFKRAKNKNCRECQLLYPELKTTRIGEEKSKKATKEDIENILITYDILIDDDNFKLENLPSRTNVPFICYYGHKSIVRFDAIKNIIKLIKENKREDICQICNNDVEELKKVMEDEELVESNGFRLKNRYTENSKIMFILKCKNGHEFSPRFRDSFLRSINENESENIKCMDCKKELNFKKCYGICKQTLEKTEFNNCISNIDGLDNHCKNCRKIERIYRNNNGYKFPSKETLTIYGIDGKMCQNIDCGFHSYENFHKDINNSDGLEKYCKMHKLELNLKARENNPDSYKKSAKKWRENNKEKLAIYRKQYREDNRERYRELARIRNKQRRDEDPGFKLLGNLRHRVRLAIKTNSKSESTRELIGCSIEDLIKHLENNFILEPREGIDGDDFIPMSWENYGNPVWHIDHIKPCSIFDLSDPLEQRRCFNWRNVQPMYAIENIIKHNKYEYDEDLENLLMEVE